jgi:hypothetical protein
LTHLAAQFHTVFQNVCALITASVYVYDALLGLKGHWDEDIRVNNVRIWKPLYTNGTVRKRKK